MELEDMTGKLSRAARPGYPAPGGMAGCSAHGHGRAVPIRRATEGRNDKTGPAVTPAGPVIPTPWCGADDGPSDGERAAAAAAARGVRVLEREAGTHHGGDVVDLHAIQVLPAERVDEETEPVALDHVVVFLGLVLD